jgi:hypothetical protein
MYRRLYGNVRELIASGGMSRQTGRAGYKNSGLPYPKIVHPYV